MQQESNPALFIEINNDADFIQYSIFVFFIFVMFEMFRKQTNELFNDVVTMQESDLRSKDVMDFTERAYDNPKFVEDMVRDIAGELNKDDRIRQYVLESENFESIHNHSAYALIEYDKDAA